MPWPPPEGWGKEWSGTKRVWLLDTRYASRALVRGRQLDGPSGPVGVDIAIGQPVGERERRVAERPEVPRQPVELLCCRPAFRESADLTPNVSLHRSAGFVAADFPRPFRAVIVPPREPDGTARSIIGSVLTREGGDWRSMNVFVNCVTPHLEPLGPLSVVLEGPAHRDDGTVNLVGGLRRAMGVTGYESLARLRAAEGLAAAGRRAEADAQLQRALAFFRSVGATRYIREGEALLAASA